MKKFICAMLTVLMVCSFVAMPTFATEVEKPETVETGDVYEIQPRGAISGNGQTVLVVE